MKVEVAVLGSPSPYALWVSVDVDQLCESRGGRPGLPVPICLMGFCARRLEAKSCVKVEVDVLVPNKPTVSVHTSTSCGRKAPWKKNV